MKKIFAIGLLLLVSLTACRKRLDSFLFNQSALTSYQLDNYTGEVSITVGDEFAVPDSMIHHLEWTLVEQGKSTQVHAIYVGDMSRISVDTVLLYCHGNKDHMDFYWPRQKLYAHMGQLGRFGVLMFDYPGFGMSEGKPTEINMYASTELALTWLKSQGLTNDRLVMMGFSLGSAAVCEVAGNPSRFSMNPSKIILEAPFASAEILIQDGGLLSMPGSFLVDLKIDNATEIKKVNAPLLWIHGLDDSFLTVAHHGQLVYDNKSGAKEKELVPGGEHETTPTAMGYTNYINRMLAFITQ
jgi:pimeloyl-ACP methyl ester carboxylesterase